MLYDETVVVQPAQTHKDCGCGGNSRQGVSGLRGLHGLYEPITMPQIPGGLPKIPDGIITPEQRKQAEELLRQQQQRQQLAPDGGSGDNWFTQDTLIKSVPNVAVVAGGGVLLYVLWEALT